MSKKQRIKARILILSLTYFPFVGGAEVAIKEITDRLGTDFEFDMLMARMDKRLAKQEKIGQTNLYRIGFGYQTFDKYIFTFFGFCKAIKLYWKNKYQIIWPIMAAYSSFAVLFKIFTSAKVVLALQEGDPIEYITGLKRFKIFLPIYKLYFKLVDRVQVISNFLAQWARDLGVKPEKIVVVPNGAAIHSFPAGKQPALQELKNKLGIEANEKVILTISRLVKKNGIEDLIRAFGLLVAYSSMEDTAAAKLPAKLVIAGDGPLRNKLQGLVKELKIKDKVIFVGQIKPWEAQKYYAIADVFCRPSLSEGFGNVFVEAMAAEVPVVAAPVGGIVDFLKDNETGWFCQSGQPENIVAKIKYILDDKNKEEVEKVIAKAKEMVEEKYTWDKVAGQMRVVFQELLF